MAGRGVWGLEVGKLQHLHQQHLRDAYMYTEENNATAYLSLPIPTHAALHNIPPHSTFTHRFTYPGFTIHHRFNPNSRLAPSASSINISGKHACMDNPSKKPTKQQMDNEATKKNFYLHLYVYLRAVAGSFKDSVTVAVAGYILSPSSNILRWHACNLTSFILSISPPEQWMGRGGKGRGDIFIGSSATSLK